MPLDDAFVEAERHGEAPIDHAPDSPGTLAIKELAQQITSLDTSALTQSAARARGGPEPSSTRR